MVLRLGTASGMVNTATGIAKYYVPLCAICNRGGRDFSEAHLPCGPEDFKPARYHRRPAKYPRLEWAPISGSLVSYLCSVKRPGPGMLSD